MSKQSTGPINLISLPKGGGALKGIGEKFSPDLFTGTGNFTIPITLPAGRNGFQPDLNLTYSTGMGNGYFGLGWALSIPGISRKTSKGVPIYDDKKDVFILSGQEDLVPTDPDRYRPRTEGLFARINHLRNKNSDYWKVESKDGLVTFYGSHQSTNPALDTATIANPKNRNKIFAWKLTETKDPFGNRILYEYERDTSDQSDRSWDQLYLKHIRYIDYGETNVSTGKFLVSVTFLYEDRPDPFSDYRAGFEIRTRKRCKRIEVHIHADREYLARSYEFVYLDQRNDLTDLNERLPFNRVSLLSQLRVTGRNGEQTEELPPLEFTFSQFEPKGRKFFPLTGSLPAQSLANSSLEMVDLFGNGLPDIVEMDKTVRYWRNQGNGCFDLPRSMQGAPAGLSLADAGVQLIDADGDGRIDLLASRNGFSGYYPLEFTGEWDSSSFRRYRYAPSFNLGDPEVRMVDLTGDGITDAIRSGDRLECYFNDPAEGWNNTRRVERKTLNAFPNINFSDSRVKWADMSGDGLQDTVLVYDGNVEYWPNKGRGNWSDRIHMKNSPRFPYGYDPKRILVGDIDGDGLADLIYIDNRKVMLWINQGGNSWSDVIEIEGTPPVTDIDAVRLVDLLGCGVSGILWSKDANTVGSDNYYFLDFTGGKKPYLLDEMNNHMGALTRIEYRPSTDYYLQDQKHPETRWKTSLPFPVHVVATVEVVDAFSKGQMTTEYRYHHGYWDGGEREFRGFGRVDQRDSEAFSRYHTAVLHSTDTFNTIPQKFFSPPVETRTWFHLGPVGKEAGDWTEVDFSNEFWSGDPQMLDRPLSMNNFLRSLPHRVKRNALRALRGRVLRTELYAIDGTLREDHPYTVAEYLPGVTALPVTGSWPATPAEWQKDVFFPHALAQRVTQWERGDDPMVQFCFTENYDDYGQPQMQIQIACPRSWKKITDTPQAAYLATCTKTEYAKPEASEHYIMDRVAKTTHYEINNDGNQIVFAVKNKAADSSVLKIIGQTLVYYDGLPYQGLGFGKVGQYGAMVRNETLIVTPEILDKAYLSISSAPHAPELPPYLNAGAVPTWSSQYPQEFRNLLKEQAGYKYYAGHANDEHVQGYFAVVGQKYDFHAQQSGGKGLLTASKDPLGRETKILYDASRLLPIQVTDPANLTTKIDYDYRVFQPGTVVDPNGNRTRHCYTPLGLLSSTAILGKVNENNGDTDQSPSIKFEYDFLAFEKSSSNVRQPVSVRTIKRTHHINESGVDIIERDKTIETIEFSDGFGRLLQTRTQAEDIVFGNANFGDVGLDSDQSAPNQDAIGQSPCAGGLVNVVVSGWQTYDNKGQVVEKYEPFYACGWTYAPVKNGQKGQKASLFYDPRGQVIRTQNPDGSLQRVIYGIPNDLSDPVQITPTPWELYTYDENDNAGRTHYNDSLKFKNHWDTPASAELDALGRTIKKIERNGPNQTDWYVTESTYDVAGNLLTVKDAMGRIAFRYLYDLTPASEEDEQDEDQGAQVLRIEQLDAGVRRIVFDAAGNEIERRDSKGALILQGYDALNRPVGLWARDNGEENISLREHLIYGDSAEAGLTQEQAESANLHGKLHQHYDEAGRLTYEAYDFKGNILEKTRQVINDASILAVFNPPPSNWDVKPFRINWQPSGGKTLSSYASSLLDANAYKTSFNYDALNRITTLYYPQDVDGGRKKLTAQYNRAGALERVELDNVPYARYIAYNAKRQRTLIAYGNGVMTRFAYDAVTFRMVRLRTERYSMPNDLAFHPTGQALQDFGYDYDLVGSILQVHDRTPGSGIPNSLNGMDALDRTFDYDPLYRLLSATGRECDTTPGGKPWDDAPKCQDPNLTRSYTESYVYDAAGNMTQLKHAAGTGVFVRSYALVPGMNRLQSMAVGQSSYAYQYDVNGNMVSEGNSRHFEWDHNDRMRVFRNQVNSSEPTVYVQYFYDAEGQRVKKLVRKPNGSLVTATVYIDELYEHRWRVNSSEKNENSTLHVMDDEKRIAMVRVGNVLEAGDNSPAVQYQLGDHLGSSNLVLNTDGKWINREEFTPYGETSFGSFAGKRYRFTGKERDEENGFIYFGARYFSPYIINFLSIDPLLTRIVVQIDISYIEKNNGYLYARSNPMKYTEFFGLSPKNEGYSPALEDINYITSFVSPGALKLNNVVNKLEAEYITALAKARSPLNPSTLMTDIPRREIEITLSAFNKAKLRLWGTGILKAGIYGGVSLGFSLFGNYFSQKREYGYASGFNLLSLVTTIASAKGVVLGGGALSLSAQGLAVVGAFIAGYALGTTLDKWTGASDTLSTVMGREDRAISRIRVSRHQDMLRKMYKMRLLSQTPLAAMLATKIRMGLVNPFTPNNEHILYSAHPLIKDAIKSIRNK